MPNIVSALTARTQLGQILRRVKKNNERFVIDRRGEPQAVIISIRDYVDNVAPAASWLKRSWADAKRKGLHKLTPRNIDAEIRRYRQEARRQGPSR